MRLSYYADETIVHLQTAYTGLCLVVASNGGSEVKAKVVR